MVSPVISLSLCPIAHPSSPQGQYLPLLWLWLLGAGFLSQLLWVSSGERAGCTMLTYFCSSREPMRDGRVLWHRVAP